MERTIEITKVYSFSNCHRKASAWLEAPYHEAFYKFTKIFFEKSILKKKTLRIIEGTHRSHISCSQHAQR